MHFIRSPSFRLFGCCCFFLCARDAAHKWLVMSVCLILRIGSRLVCHCHCLCPIGSNISCGRRVRHTIRHAPSFFISSVIIFISVVCCLISLFAHRSLLILGSVFLRLMGGPHRAIAVLVYFFFCFLDCLLVLLVCINLVVSDNFRFKDRINRSFFFFLFLRYALPVCG